MYKADVFGFLFIVSAGFGAASLINKNSLGGGFFLILSLVFLIKSAKEAGKEGTGQE